MPEEERNKKRKIEKKCLAFSYQRLVLKFSLVFLFKLDYSFALASRVIFRSPRQERTSL